MSKKWARLDLENSTFDLCVRSICNKYCDQGKLSRVAKLFKIVFNVRIRTTHRFIMIIEQLDYSGDLNSGKILLSNFLKFGVQMVGLWAMSYVLDITFEYRTVWFLGRTVLGWKN